MNGPLGRTVADTAALLDALSGYEVGDPYWLPTPQPGFLGSLKPPDLPLRLGYVTALDPIGAVDPVCRQAIVATAQRAEALGHRVEPVSFPPMDALVDPFVMVWQSVLAESAVPWIVLERFNRWLYWRARWVSSGAYLRAVTQIQQIARQIVQFCQPYDALILPVYMHPTIRVGEWKGLRSPRILTQVINWVAPCPPSMPVASPPWPYPRAFPRMACRWGCNWWVGLPMKSPCWLWPASWKSPIPGASADPLLPARMRWFAEAMTMGK